MEIDMDSVYHGDWAEPQWNGATGWQVVQQEFSTDAPEPFRVLYARYVYEDYNGDADVIWQNEDGSFGYVSGGHCSCYGLENQWEPETYSEEVVLAGIEAGERWSIFQRFKDIFAQAIEARRAETETGSVHESAVHAPKES